jgi:hypothetical protein
MHDEQKSREQELAAELVALERQLRGMTPTPPRVDRDCLMFAAGQAAGAASQAEPGQYGRAMYDESGRPLHIAGPSWTAHRFWPAATFAMTAATLLLGTMLVWQNRSQSVPQLTASPQPTAKLVGPSRSEEADQVNRFAIRNVWSTSPPASSGYLGIRYVALTRGSSDFPPEYESPNDDSDLPAGSDAKPATARRLLDELLPAHSHSHSSRS